MALLFESELRQRASSQVARQAKSVGGLLSERATVQLRAEKYDIFLSHSFADKELILGAALILEDAGYTVYVDWRDDPLLDRSKVTPATATVLRHRMKLSRCLFYSTTTTSSDSKWMPWELGFKDGHNTRAAILPIVLTPTATFAGQEYLGLYPYVDKTAGSSGQPRLWIHRSPSCWVHFDDWLKGGEPVEH